MTPGQNRARRRRAYDRVLRLIDRTRGRLLRIGWDNDARLITSDNWKHLMANLEDLQRRLGSVRGKGWREAGDAMLVVNRLSSAVQSYIDLEAEARSRIGSHTPPSARYRGKEKPQHSPKVEIADPTRRRVKSEI